MMTIADIDREAILLAVRQDPKDDMPRMAFADWLDENGLPENARFIRVQLEMARQRRGCRCRPCATGRAERIGVHCLLEDPELRMLSGRLRPVALDDYHPLWMRGFVAGVSVSLAEFTDGDYGLARCLFDQHPLEWVFIKDARPLRFERRYLWHDSDSPLASGDVQADHLPARLFGALRGFVERGGRVNSLVKAYPCRNSAVSALQRACIRVGRELAGLRLVEVDRS